MILERGDVWKVPVAKGIWTAGRSDSKKRRHVFMSCPKCGMVMGLAPGGVYRIAADGQVTPSSICSCGFKDYVTLKGWRP